MTFYIVVLNTLPLFVIYSNLVSGFESTAVHEIRKYKFYDIACSDVLFVVHRYHYKFVGLAGSGIDSATIQNFCLHLQRRIEWAKETSLHTF